MFRLVLLIIFCLSFGKFRGYANRISEDNIVASCADSLPFGGYSTPESYQGFKLAWQDEFNSNGQPDPAKWTYALGDGCPNLCGWGNEEIQFYTKDPRNVYLKDGFLVIKALKENISGHQYSSARIKTEGLQHFKYGRIDVRAVLPYGQGIWPAIWMLGESLSQVGWPRCGEIDIMEMIGHEPARIYGTAHWHHNGQGHQYITGQYYLPQGQFADLFHVFSIVWDEQGITWLVDDQEYHRLTNEDFGSQNPFNATFYLLMNIAVGGQWPGYPDETTISPQQMLVDYVRYFQRQ